MAIFEGSYFAHLLKQLSEEKDELKNELKQEKIFNTMVEDGYDTISCYRASKFIGVSRDFLTNLIKDDLVRGNIGQNNVSYIYVEDLIKAREYAKKRRRTNKKEGSKRLKALAKQRASSKGKVNSN